MWGESGGAHSEEGLTGWKLTWTGITIKLQFIRFHPEGSATVNVNQHGISARRCETFDNAPLTLLNETGKPMPTYYTVA